MMAPTLKVAMLAVGAALAGNAAAIDFLQAYRLARQNDATFAAARAGLEAGLEKLPQGRALLLPVINGDGEHELERRPERDRQQGHQLQLERLQHHPHAAAVPLAEPRPVPAVAVPGSAVGGAVRAGDPGPGRARRAGLLRRARGAGQPRVHQVEQDLDRRAARPGEAQLRGRHGDHHRHQRSAGALRSRGRAGDRGPERARGRGARAGADHRRGAGQAHAAEGGRHDDAGAQRHGRVGECGPREQSRGARQRGGARDRHARGRPGAHGTLPVARCRRELSGSHHPEPGGGVRGEPTSRAPRFSRARSDCS